MALAIVAIIFLAAYSVQVLAQPHGRFSVAIDLVIAITYAVFVVDYLARLSLATNRPRWFVHHLVDLAVIALPLLVSDSFGVGDVGVGFANWGRRVEQLVA